MDNFIPDSIRTKKDFYTFWNAAHVEHERPATSAGATESLDRLVAAVENRIIAGITAASRKPEPGARQVGAAGHPSDHVGAHLEGFTEAGREIHRAAVAFMERNGGDYRSAVVACSKRTSGGAR